MWSPGRSFLSPPLCSSHTFRIMAHVNCPKCSRSFDPTNHMATGGGAAAGAAGGAYIGSMFGIAGGPLGAIAGTIPGAIIGGALGGLGISKFAKCPGCDKTFMI